MLRSSMEPNAAKDNNLDVAHELPMYAPDERQENRHWLVPPLSAERSLATPGVSAAELSAAFAGAAVSATSAGAAVSATAAATAAATAVSATAALSAVSATATVF